MPRDHIREFYEAGGYIPKRKPNPAEAVRRVRAVAAGVPGAGFDSSLGPGRRVGFAKEGLVKPLLQLWHDIPSTKIANWAWKPLSEAAAGMPSEVPEHILNYGDFMRRMAGKAGQEGVSPRDLIKAYTTTLSSMNRQAIDRAKIPGLTLSSPEQMIRPEGAFADWLGSKPGQRYLDRAVQGEADPESISNMVSTLRSFGLMPTLGKRMAEAPSLFVGNEGKFSDIIDRASRGQATPEEWHAAMTGIPGIKAAKRGFMGSMLGYGDMPTFDARQIERHVIDPSLADKFTGRVGGGEEAVARLAARQRAMGVELPSEYDPYAQHLWHHTAWEAPFSAAEPPASPVTHSDIIDTMLNRAQGGRVGYFDGGQKLAKVIFGSRPLQQFQRWAAMGPEERILQRFARQTGLSEDELAKRLATTTAGVAGSDLTNTGLSNIRGMTPFFDATGRFLDPKMIRPRPVMTSLEPLLGGVGVSGMSDRTGAGYGISSLMGHQLDEPLMMSGGPDYPRWHPGQLWASAKGALQGMLNPLEAEGIDPDAPKYFLNKLMNRRQAADQSHMAQMLAANALGNADVSGATERGFNKFVRNINFLPTGKTERVFPLSDFPGMKSDELQEYLADKPMSKRAFLLQAMDKAGWQNKGIPAAAPIRMSVMDPHLAMAPEGTVGRTIGRINMDDPLDFAPDIEHASYPVALRGQYMGGTDRPVPPWMIFRDWWKTNEAGLPGKDPNVATTMSSWRNSPVTQVFNQQWLDRAEPEFQALQERWKARGGSIRDRERYHPMWATDREEFARGGHVDKRYHVINFWDDDPSWP